jgi:hypothetical protein
MCIYCVRVFFYHFIARLGAFQVSVLSISFWFNCVCCIDNYNFLKIWLLICCYSMLDRAMLDRAKDSVRIQKLRITNENSEKIVIFKLA